MPIPAALIDPGATCLKVAVDAGQQTMMQTVMIGTQMGENHCGMGSWKPGSITVLPGGFASKVWRIKARSPSAFPPPPTPIFIRHFMSAMRGSNIATISSPPRVLGFNGILARNSP